MNKIIVIAGNHEQYMNFLSDVNLSDRDKFIEADRPEKIQGVEACHVINIGTGYKRGDYHMMNMLAKSRILP